MSGSFGLDLGSLCLPAVGRRQKRCRDGNKGKSATAARTTFIYRTSRALRSAHNGLRRCMDVRCTLCDVHCGMHKKMTCLAWRTCQPSMCVSSRLGEKLLFGRLTRVTKAGERLGQGSEIVDD